MISWRKYVDSFDDDEVRLKVHSTDIRFSYLQPDEVLVARDLLNKQIVDTRGMRVVRVNDLKLSNSGTGQLRLLGAEVGARGILRSLSPSLERLCCRIAHAFGKSIPERVIAWNYMDLLDRDLSNVKLSVSHKTLDELHPADIADIIEQLDPRLRGQVFAQLDDERAAEAMAELDDDEMAAEIMGDMEDVDASKMLSEMDPDDAAELVGELDYEKAEKLLRLMGVKEQKAVRQLLGYRDDTAGRIMTSEFVAIPEGGDVSDAVGAIRDLDEDFETVHYVYLVDDERKLTGVVTLHQLLVAQPDSPLRDMAETDVISASPDDDQEDVAEDISKYNLLAMPVVDEGGRILGIVTVDDALDVMEEEHEEDLQIAGSTKSEGTSGESTHELRQFLVRQLWFFFWMAGALLLGLGFDTPMASQGIALAFALPVALLASDSMARYVTNFFLEFDEDDEDAPSMAGFAFKGIGIGVVYALIMLLVETAVGNALGAAGLGATDLPAWSTAAVISCVSLGFDVAAVVSLVSFATAPIYLTALRRRDAANKETSGVSIHVCALAIATVLFCALCAACVMVGILG
jgi:Mg2+ transporter MgtE